MNKKKSTPPWLKPSFYVKLGLVAGLLYFLAKKGFISLQATQQALSHYELIIPALLAMAVNSILGAIRWQWLLEAQGIRLAFGRVFQLTYIGNFFNIALPGAVSGDFVKAFYVGKEVKGQRARAFGSILFDRVAGLSALVLVSAGAIAIGFRDFEGSPMLSAIQVSVALAAVAVVAFYTYLFLVREHHDPLLKLFRSLEKKFPRSGSLVRIYEGIRHYHNHRITVIKVLILSVAVHLVVGWVCLTFARALGEQALALLPLYVVVPLGILVTAVPVMPAGVGTGNVAFLYLFKLLGSDRGADVFSLFALSNIFFGALGGLVYLRFKGHEPQLDLTK